MDTIKTCNNISKLLIYIIIIIILGTILTGCIEETKEPVGNDKTHIEIATDFMKNYSISSDSMRITWDEIHAKADFGESVTIGTYGLRIYGDKPDDY